MRTILRKRAVGVFAFFFILSVSTASAEPVYREDFVAPVGMFPANHGVTLAELPSGELIGCWYAGSAEKGKDVQIYCSNWNPWTQAWTPPSVAVSHQEKSGAFPFFKNVTVGNPALYMDRDNTLWLFYSAVSIFSGWSGAHVDYKVSRDFGQTWSKPRNMKAFFGNLTRNKPIALNDHQFVVPLYHELIGRRGYTCTVTPKDGKIWEQECRDIYGSGHIQPTLILRENRLLAFLRTQHKENVKMAEFDFNNDDWTEATPTNLPNPDSAVDSVLTPDGIILLAFNDSYTNRYPLSLAYTLDGQNFTKIWDFETMPGRSSSYPAIIRTRDGWYHVAYTYDFRSAIKHVSFNEEWLRQRLNRH